MPTCLSPFRANGIWTAGLRSIILCLRSVFGHKWRGAIETVGLSAGTGFHALRHYYASLLIRHGESVKTVQERLGHASAVETLDTYSHLWPDSDDRTREAIDSVLGSTADALRTEVAVKGLARTSWPVSRILFRAAGFRRGGGDHPSGHTVTGCLERPTRRLGRAALERLRSRTGVRPLGLASGGVYRAIPVTRDAGALLPHRFTLTAAPENFGGGGGLFSVALSRESPRIAVSNHPAL